MSVAEVFFSVVIPVHNRTDVIHRALGTLLEQTFTNFEVVVVDDGSDDGAALRSVVDSYSDRLNIKVHRYETNVNGAYARNLGIKAATGRYIAFLDSDDCWVPERLEVAANTIVSNNRSEFTIFYSRITRCANQDDPEAYLVPNCQKGEESVSEYIFLRNGFIQTSTIVCARRIALEIAFDERFTRHQDYDFCFRAESVGYDFTFIDYNCGWWIRGHDGQALASVGYRLWWAEEMRQYMTPRAYYAYLVGLVMPRAVSENRWLITIMLLLKCLGRAPNYVYLNACRRSVSLWLNQ
ncbi:MAG: glycosyltransferase family 2 protein [Pseudomonadales bacterium]|nr:glycosyltransferase family 2 protein [Pseudomonadales bacterium]